MDAGYWMRDTGCGMLDGGFWMEDGALQTKILKL